MLLPRRYRPPTLNQNAGQAKLSTRTANFYIRNKILPDSNFHPTVSTHPDYPVSETKHRPPHTTSNYRTDYCHKNRHPYRSYTPEQYTTSSKHLFKKQIILNASDQFGFFRFNMIHDSIGFASVVIPEINKTPFLFDIIAYAEKFSPQKTVSLERSDSSYPFQIFSNLSHASTSPF